MAGCIACQADGIKGLETVPGGGRPLILNPEKDLAVVRQAVQKHRQRISLAKAELEEAFAVKFCERTLSRFLKNLMLVTNASENDRKESKMQRFTS